MWGGKWDFNQYTKLFLKKPKNVRITSYYVHIYLNLLIQFFLDLLFNSPDIFFVFVNMGCLSACYKQN